MKKHLHLVLLCLFSVCLGLKAEVYSGECGKTGSNLSWTLDTETGELVISGEGEMNNNPWITYKDYIRSVSIQDGVLNIVNSAFADCSNLANVTIAETVSKIEYYAFLRCTSLNSCSIPSSVQKIGSSAFEDCTGLLNISIPSATVESYVFQGCTNLKEVSIQNGVTEIKKGVFDNCTLIEKVIIADGNGTLTLGAGGGYSKGLFRDSQLKELYVGRNLEYNTSYDYGSSPFYALSTLVSLTIGSKVSSLNDNAFSRCDNLSLITFRNAIPPTCGANVFSSSITSTCKLIVPSSALETYKSISPWSEFANYEGFASGTCGDNLTWELSKDGVLTIDGTGEMLDYGYQGSPWYEHRGQINRLVIKDNVTSIGDYAFYNCSSLTSVIIPNSVTSMGRCAFSGCCSLTSITIPESITTIRAEAFYNCSKLNDIEIPSSVTTIGKLVFYGTRWWNMQADGLVYLDSWLLGYKGKSYQGEMIVVEGTKRIANDAFELCAPTSITIPNSVISIGSNAFEGCSLLTSVHISDIVAWCNIEFANFYSNPLVFANHLYLNGEEVKNLVIPDGVTSIGNMAFHGCSAMSSITIPNSMLYIGNEAFYDCKGLTSIIIPNNVISIGEYAFSCCNNVTSITLGNKVKSIGTGAFYMCGFSSVTIPNSVTNIGSLAFKSCFNLTDIKIPNSVISIGSGVFDESKWWDNHEDGLIYLDSWLLGYKGEKPQGDIVIEQGTKSIVSGAFAHCRQLTSIEIPKGLKSIGKGAFNYCTNLSSITCLNSVPPTFEGTTFNDVPTSTCKLVVPASAIELYASTSPWNEFKNIEGLQETITINQYGSGTYCSDCALDFSNVNGLKAYVATGYNSHTGVITLTRVMTAKAGVGLFVMGEPGEYNVPVMESTDDNSLNMLVGTLERTPVNGTSNDGLYYNYRYTIKQDSNVPLFYRIDDGYTLGAGKAYLQIPVAWIPTTSESRVISLKIDEENTTDIEEEEKNPVEQIYYDIMGRKVKHIRKGMIYIINGKKTIIN